MSIISMITGNDTPVGEQWVDDRIEEAKRLGAQAVQQVKAWSMDDPDTWTDNALRWVGGKIKGTGNWWQENTAEQEGLHDDFLRSVGWGANQALRVLDVGSYYGGKIGGNIASMIGVDSRIGGAAGNFLGDALMGGAIAKGFRVGKATRALSKLDPIARGAVYTEVMGGGHVGAAKLAMNNLENNLTIAARGVLQETQEELAQGVGKVRRALKVAPYQTSLLDEGFGTGKKMRDEVAEVLNKIYTAGLSKADNAALRRAGYFGTASGDISGIADVHRTIFRGSPHHFSMDLSLSGKVLNRKDAPEIIKILTGLDIYPGNHPKNYIMAYHDYTKNLTDDLTNQLVAATGKPKREVIDFLKNTAGKSWDKYLDVKPKIAWKKGKAPRDLWKEGTAGLTEYTYGKTTEQVKGMLANLPKTQHKSWNKFLEGTGKTVKDFKLPKINLGLDHQQFIHGIGDKLPLRQQLIDLAASPEWLKYTPDQAAQKIAQVAIQQQNIAVNVNAWRLDKIKKAMNFNPATQDWTDIQVWMMRNPEKAASLDWYKSTQEGLGLVMDRITDAPDPKVYKEVAQIFNLEYLPDTIKKYNKRYGRK